MEIIPAILPHDVDDIREHLAFVRGLVPLVQIDVTDGRFTPDATWPYVNDHGDFFERMVREEEAMPYWQEIGFEVDLMVHQAEVVVMDWVKAGARRVIPHVESDSDIEKIITDLREITNDKESVAYTEIGLALNTTTPVEEVTSFLEREENTIDFVQCMGIERIGYQGEDFDERVLTHIVDIRSRYPDAIISVDGGVSIDTAAELVQAGASRLVSGSAVFESEDVAQAIAALKSAANSQST